MDDLNLIYKNNTNPELCQDIDLNSQKKVLQDFLIKIFHAQKEDALAFIFQSAVQELRNHFYEWLVICEISDPQLFCETYEIPLKDVEKVATLKTDNGYHIYIFDPKKTIPDRPFENGWRIRRYNFLILHEQLQILHPKVWRIGELTPKIQNLLKVGVSEIAPEKVSRAVLEEISEEVPDEISQDFFQELLKIYHDNQNESPETVLGALYFNFEDYPFIAMSFKWDAEHAKIVKKPMVHWKTDSVQERREKLEEVLKNFQKGRFYQGIAIVLDELDWAVVDIDNVKVFSREIQNVEEFLKEAQNVSPLISKTLQKGYHIFLPKALFSEYIKLELINNHELLSRFGFEIRHQLLLIIPPSRLQYNGKLYEYKILHVNPELTPTRDELLRFEGFQKIFQILEKKKANMENKLKSLIDKEKLKKEYEEYAKKVEEERKDYNLNEVIEEVKKKIKFEDLIPDKVNKRYADYTMFHCPFHPPDHHPSFSVCEWMGAEYGKDFHDKRSYDIIAFWQAYKNLDFIEALKELCNVAGIKFPERKELKKKDNTEKNNTENAEKYKIFSIEEKVLGLCSKILIQNSNIDQKKDVREIIFFLNSRDFISIASCRSLLAVWTKVLKKDDILHNDIWQSFEIELERYNDTAAELDKITWNWFYELFSLPVPTTIENLYKLLNELIESWKNKKIRQIRKKIANDELITEEKLEQYKLELKEIETVKVSKDVEESEILKLELKGSKSEDFNMAFHYLYPKFIPAGTISFWAALPAQGKSALALFLSLYLLDTGSVKKVYYFDGDNPSIVLEQRNIKKILEQYKGRLFYIQESSHESFQKDLRRTIYAKEECLIIVDTLRACIGPFDINKGEVAEKFMALLKEIIQDSKKTIIVLHHLNKPPASNPHIEPIDRIKGASEFRDRCDIAYILYKVKLNNSSLFVKLENVKPRVPVRNTIFFEIDIQNAKVTEIDQVLTEEEEEFVQTILEEIQAHYKEKSSWPTKRHLEDTFKERFGRNKVRNWIKRFIGKYWNEKHIRYKNSIVIAPLQEEIQEEKEPDKLPF